LTPDGVGSGASSAPASSVSVIVPVRNERQRIAEVLAGIEAQTVRPIEVVVADGASTDGTREWLEGAASTRPWLRVVDNPDRVIPAGLNRCVRVCTGDVVARMDAHAGYAPDYLETLLRFLDAHPDVPGAGGLMRTVGEGRWGHAIAAVLSRPWGLGGAPHRVGGSAGPVDHVFCTAYRREAILKAGGWDRAMLANEDAELDYRVGAGAGRIWLEPSATSVWTTRSTPGALARQMWRYGYYRARTVHLHPRSLRWRHLAPVVVAAGLPGLVLARRRAGLAATAAYLGAAGALGGATSRAAGASAWRGAIALPVVHLCWGGGMAAGLVRHRGARSEPGLR
jgi:succinoglycan biosynthesis protein ExoA